jgi:4-amino-4-deoxy-L-arabinose transferase-like glycosyltransferase
MLLPALLIVFFLWVSFYGLNFGVHWDEPAAKLDSVRDTVKTGLFLQGSGGAYDGFNYNYGGVNYLLTWAGFTPELVKFFKHGNMTRAGLSDLISPIVYSMPIRLRVRALYLVICSLSILWLFLLVIVLGRSRLEAFLASAILAASWEVQYHSRWIAPDEVMMQFALLAILLFAIGWSSKKFSWFWWGAIAMGLAIGTKYNAGLLLPFFLIGSLLVVWQQTRSASKVFMHGAGFGGTSILTFVLTSPGIVIDPFHFFYQVQLQRSIYAAGWFGYTVPSGIPYFWAVLRYAGLQVFSHYWPLSVIIGVFCLIGFVRLVLDKPRWPGIVMTGFVVAYLAYFSQQSALIVRNLLVVIPILCLAASRGIVFAAAWIHPRFPKLKTGLYAWIALTLAINMGWEIYAARQVKRRQHFDYFVAKFENYARNAPGETFLVSTGLSNILQSVPPATLPSNIVTDSKKPYTRVAFLQSEGPELDKFWPKWPANWWGMYETTFGALEVNLDAYPTFVGNPRILLVSAEHFRKLPIQVQDLGR